MKLCYSDNLDLRCAKNMSLYSLYLTHLGAADFLLSKKISNDQELIQSDPISCPQNQKGK